MIIKTIYYCVMMNKNIKPWHICTEDPIYETKCTVKECISLELTKAFDEQWIILPQTPDQTTLNLLRKIWYINGSQ